MIKAGDKVVIKYIAAIDNEIIEESDEPLDFIAGAGEVMSIFDKGVIGMKKGEEKELVLLPEDEFGHPQDDLISKIPRVKLGPQEIFKDQQITMDVNNKEIDAKVVHVNEEEVTVDLNHPMAGKNVLFRIKVLDVIPA